MNDLNLCGLLESSEFDTKSAGEDLALVDKKNLGV
jgi:hypothetical protein